MSTIQNNLKANIMREHMEDKNTLNSKGSLYVGLGTTHSVSSEIIQETDKLSVGSNNQVLIADSSTSSGLKYGLIQAANISDEAITKEKINSNVADQNFVSNNVTKMKLSKEDGEALSLIFKTKFSDIYIEDSTLYFVINNDFDEEV